MPAKHRQCCHLQAVMPRWQEASPAARWCHQRAPLVATQIISTHGMAILLARPSCMMITAWLAEQLVTLVHLVISNAMLMINLKLGLSCLTWIQASLGLLRLTPHYCTRRNLVPAVQMLANQVPAVILSFLPTPLHCRCKPPLLNLTSVVSCVCMFAACCKDRQGVSLQLNAGRHILPPCRDRPNNIRVCIDMLV